MVSPAITWKGGILSFFTGEKRLKRSENLYLEHLQNQMIPPLEVLFPDNVSIFIQDRAPSHIAKKIQNFLKERLKSPLVKNIDRFRCCSKMVGAKMSPLPKIYHTYSTMMKLGTIIPYLKKIHHIYKSRNTFLDFC